MVKLICKINDNGIVIIDRECEASVGFTIWVFGIYRANVNNLENVLSQNEFIEITQIANSVVTLIDQHYPHNKFTFNYRDYPNLYNRYIQF